MTDERGAIFNDKMLKLVREGLNKDMRLCDALESESIQMTRLEAILIVKAMKQTGSPKTQAYYRLKNFINRRKTV